MNIQGLTTGFQAMAAQLNKGGIKSPNPAVDRFKPCDISFTPPNFDTMWTKREPEMSESEYEQAITEQAQKDFANGYRRGQSRESVALMQSFVSVVSPDRKGIYEESMAKTGGKMNVTHSFFDSNMKPVLIFNTQEKQWMRIGTDKEGDRKQQYYDIYNKAYIAASEAAKSGQSQSSTSTSRVDITA